MKTSPLTRLAMLCLGSVLLLVFTGNQASAYPRYYNDSKTPGSNCSQCHGAFTSDVSPKGTVFPEGNKHVMHGRENTYMDTECNLCHSNGDNHNPYTASSEGTANNIGYGCTGCHEAEGLRAHHVNNGVFCGGCHDAPTPSTETNAPPYYGTVDTLVQNPCNDVLASNTNENWSVGDFLGTDNDGDNLYDLADFDCGHPYQLVDIVREGDNIRVTWETAGGRTDAIQASGDVNGTYTDVSGVITNSGVGLTTTNFVEIGGAAGTNRFYRVRYVP